MREGDERITKMCKFMSFQSFPCRVQRYLQTAAATVIANINDYGENVARLKRQSGPAQYNSDLTSSALMFR